MIESTLSVLQEKRRAAAAVGVDIGGDCGGGGVFVYSRVVVGSSGSSRWWRWCSGGMTKR